MNAAEIIILVLIFLNVFGSALLHDKPKTGKHNAVQVLISQALLIGLLYWAGLFH